MGPCLASDDDVRCLSCCVAGVVAVLLALAAVRTDGARPQPRRHRGRVDCRLLERARTAAPVIFIGLDGADWQLLDDYMAAGVMPNLKRLVREGTRAASLDTMHPPLSPLIWTTMMTGVSPLDHGILDFAASIPSPAQKEPITSDERRAPAIWNMATSAGKQGRRLRLVGDVPRGTGQRHDRVRSPVHVSLQGVDAAGRRRVSSPSARRGRGRPLQRAERRRDLRRLQDISAVADEQEYAAARRVAGSVRASGQRAAPHPHRDASLRRSRRGPGSSARSRTSRSSTFRGPTPSATSFAPFAPPKQPTIAQADYDRYSGVPRRYFPRSIDSSASIASWRRNTARVLMLASDHGFAWREGRPSSSRAPPPPTAAKWHRNQGIYVCGEGAFAARGAIRPPAASVRQVCATLLAAAGLPPIKGEDASPLPGSPAFSTARRRITRALPPDCARDVVLVHAHR